MLGSRMVAGLLAPVAVLAAALGAWRFGADPGWTNHFFIAKGLLSHWQAWFAVAIGVHTCSRSLNRWLERHIGATNNDRYFNK
jgi:hypothetical protein